MCQALHIFRKDVRKLWWEIVIVLAVATGYTLLACSREYAQVAGFIETLTSLLGLAWVSLTVLDIQDESLVGDRQFWLTRPYAWKSLLAAKAVFIVTFVNLLLLVSDCVILISYGFSPTAHVAGLLWKQVRVTILVLPVAALAVVTETFVQAALVVLGTAAAMATLASFTTTTANPLWGIDWIPETLQSALWLSASLAVLLWQYRRRATAWPRIIFACAILLTPLIPGSGKFAYTIQSHFPPAAPAYSSVALAFDPGPRGRLGKWGPQGTVSFLLPVQIAGLEAGADLQSDGFNLSIQSPGGDSWQSGWTATPPGSRNFGLNCESPRGPCFAAVYAAARFAKYPAAPVRLRLSMALTVFVPERTVTVRPSQDWFHGPDAANCRIVYLGPSSDRALDKYLECVGALRKAPRVVVYTTDPNRAAFRYFTTAATYSPYPADVTFFPVFRFFSRDTGQTIDPLQPELKFVTQRPVAHFIREIDIPVIRLSQYAAW
jgi:hypothetical protein